jgi:acyl carrier protein
VDKKNKNRVTLKKYLEKNLENQDVNGVSPEDLKTMVFDTLDTLEMVGHIADLFTAKFIRSEVDLFDIIDSANRSKKRKNNSSKK